MSSSTKSHEELFAQQEALFTFFTNGSAALESFGYAAFAMGAMLRPVNFRMATKADRRAINPEKTEKLFSANFSGTAIARALSSIVKDQNFRQWASIRNVLMH